MGQPADVPREDRQEAERREAILSVSVQPLENVDPFEIGVWPSELARRASPNEEIPPYVTRHVDTALREMLSEDHLDLTRRLVVLRGDPKSGKSRTLWEAVSTIKGRNLLALAPPRPEADMADPRYEPLVTLLTLHRPFSTSGGRDLLIWIDDAHEHLDHGLTRENIHRLVNLYPASIVVLTIHSAALEARSTSDRLLYTTLRSSFDRLELQPTLNRRELAEAKQRYPTLADNEGLVRIAELFAGVNLLTERYRARRADEPVGVAVAKATIDWERCGMPAGSLDRGTLEELTAITLRDIAPARTLDAGNFSTGLLWSAEPVAAFAALVKREGIPISGEYFRAFPAVVSWAETHDPPIGDDIWSFVLARAIGRDLLGVGISAEFHDEPLVGERALRRLMESGDADWSPRAAAALGAFLGEQERLEDAKAALRWAIDSRQYDIANVSEVTLGRLLEREGEVVGAEAAYRSVLRSADTAQASYAALELGRLLLAHERWDEAETALRQALGSGHPDYAPEAAVNLAVLLVLRERFEEAELLYRQVIEFGHPEQSPIAAIALGAMLSNQGRFEEAEAAYLRGRLRPPQVRARSSSDKGDIAMEARTLRRCRSRLPAGPPELRRL